MDKLITTLFAIETLELTKNSLERKCIALTEKIGNSKDSELVVQLNKLLADHGRVDSQLKRLCAMKCEVESRCDSGGLSLKAISPDDSSTLVR